MSNQTPTLLAIGDSNAFKIVFNKINQTCSKAANRIEIKEHDREGESKSYEFRIDTKYYELSMKIRFLSFESSENAMKANLKRLLDEENVLVEAVFVLLSEPSDKSKVDILSESFHSIDNAKRCFNVLLYQEGQCETIENLANKFTETFFCIKLDSNEPQQINDSNKLLKDEDEMEESGFDELINCLFVHEWQTMSLKSEIKTNTQTPVKQEELSKTEFHIENQTAAASKERESDKEEVDDDFESLLTNLSEMRNKAANMSEEERKTYAEDVVKKFWKAIGGDEEDL